MICTCDGRGTCTACRLAEGLNAARATVEQVRADAATWQVERRRNLLNGGEWVPAGHGLEVRLS